MKFFTKKSGFDALPALLAVSAVALVASIGVIFLYAPVESSMGIVQKIFYFHVPSAIAAYVGFTICLGASIGYLLKGDYRFDVWARAGAELGVLFCAFVLISGPLWARKAWGTWWTGEPRLMLVVVMFLVFVAYVIVRQLGGHSDLTRKICAALAILGFADIPLIRVAVARWRGNHPQVITGDGGGITSEMGVALTCGFIAILLLFSVLMWLRVRVGYASEDIETAHRFITGAGYRAEELKPSEAKS